MRRQISLLLAVISTAIVVSFVIPLLLLVRTLAEDRGMAAASQQANTIAVLVSSLHDDPRLAEVIQPSLERSAAQTSVVLADGQVLGVRWDDAATDPAYLQAKQGQAFSVHDAAGGRVYVPVLVDGGVVVVRSAMTADQLAEGVPLAWASIIGLGLLLSGVAVLVGAQVGRGISRPLLSVAETAHRLREGDLAARAPLAGPRETVELGSALNGLADRIETLLTAERDNVRGLAHRLRTPVTALRLEAEHVSDPQLRAGLADSVVGLQTAIDEVVREAQRPLREDLPGSCDAVAVVSARAEFWRPLAEDQGRAFTVSLPDGRVRVGLSALDMGDVVDICLDNIFAHTPDGIAFAINLSVGMGRVELAVTDEGPGFPVKPGEPKPGTSGMGLQIVRRLVEAAHGGCTTSPPRAHGGRVVIELPEIPH
ncbi:HAMP domain-containing sensor histidine kinase [Propionicimonas sp.]|uniref:HAMP domain-containing sensor histidine kinase n=1 Tax=Propionicimonas sp. TaxID=1955623 RepID=UPI0017CD8975|nr:HAMP domain-containing sensor histidine kinase [Propionicimonas sp.]MBU3977772.1 HAMP domain-containing histidine kinase [Actinomycetota bacterium]MBA3021695.1 HAMP domain-containing histidine kinase [Propionicimonas sp.]MBU3987246.1 HAMP domain-containing histidine kinase [Actinomycetota bacterium]MBU4009067.1 HAMP domain-containing histidine kinase [Actinomycetota bacterium]MBU4065783.1 HAMP domain-containing histidine kinase [Actinomycetota bacterium]